MLLRICLLCSVLVAGLAGCAESPTTLVASSPRWTCPSPTAVATIQVEDGQSLVNGTPVPSYRDTEPYEIEYGSPMTPTPWIKEGTSFYLDQIVNLGGGVDVQLSATPTDAMLGDQRIYDLALTVTNPGAPFNFNVARQVAVTMIKVDGRMQSGTWRWSVEAANAWGGADSVRGSDFVITTGTTTLNIPIAAPDGAITATDIRFDFTPPEGEPVLDDLRVSFSASSEDDCPAPGTLGADYQDPALRSLAAPSGPVAASIQGVVQFAKDQLGRQYCWGGKGWQPCSGCDAGSGCVTPACASYPCWDCSGLTWGAYQYGADITIGHGTSNQKNYQAIDVSQVQPGDLLLFAGGPVGSGNRFSGIRHVGLYAGDLDGDGTGDMIHSANYPDGVGIAYDVLNNSYYRARLAVITRP